MKKPNILLIVVDALRFDACFGEDRNTVTPFIDKISQEGTVFKNSISSTSYTTPNFASILTGRYSPGHGIRRFLDRLGDVETLPCILKDHGYNTHAEVTGPLRPEVGLNRGFDEYNYREGKQNIHTEWGKELFKNIDKFSSPWFLLLHLWCVHQPRIAPSKYDRKKFGRNLYERSVSALDEQLERLLRFSGDDTLIILTGDHGEYIPRNKKEDIFDRYKHHYFRLKRMNKSLRKVIEGAAGIFLRKRKAAKSLKRRFTDDSGFFKIAFPHGEHLYDYLIRTPYILYYPEIFPKKILDEQFVQIDILPTLLGALGMENVPDIDGRNFYPAIQGIQSIKEKPAYLECIYTQHRPQKSEWLIGLRTNHYKFCYTPFNPQYPPEYYDLSKDPDEKHNLAGKSADQFEDLKKMAREYFDSGKDVAAETASADNEKLIQTLKDLNYMD